MKGFVEKWEKYWEEFSTPLSQRVYLELITKRIFEACETLLNLDEVSSYDRECICIIDVGCGTGYLDILLSEKRNFHIVGVDISKNALNIAKKDVEDNNLKHKISFVKGDVFNLPSKDGAFDIAVSTGYGSAVTYLNGTEEVIRTVKKEGVIIFDFIRMPNLYQPLKSIRGYLNYRWEVQKVEEGGKWGDPGLKHYHFGKLGLKKRFEEVLELKIIKSYMLFTYPPVRNRKFCLMFENTLGKVLSPLLSRVLVLFFERK